ncbi:NACHT domain-containing protein [Streptomyces alboflavus]|uniref:NACHT domain-containing protein n=1 Tax=Streptomyces alboflavus TaxID=67267 RepID=UPI0036ABBBE1
MRESTGVRWLLGGGVVVLVAGCGWAGWSVRDGGLGPGDMAGVLGVPLGVLGILVGAGVGLSALRLQRASDARAVALDRLARAVGDVEVAERTHMLGTGGHLIDLAVDVTPRWGGAEPPGPQRLSDVARWYCAEPGRLVVTGEPGAGKTVFAVHLVVRLLDARGTEDAVPVRLAIRDLPPARTRRRWWGGRRTVGGFEHWLKDSLVKSYEVPGVVAADLVSRRLVVPVLDGLDEMDPEDGEPERACQALAELNAYQGAGGSAPLVLTCREQRYAELSGLHTWLREATLLRVGGVDAEQAQRYVALRSDGRASPMDAVVDAMRDGTASGAVAEALSSPFYLGLAFAVYGESADVAPPVSGASADEIREQLLARYVPAATRSANEAVRRARGSLTGDLTVWGWQREYAPRRVHRWLGRMAQAAERGGATHGRVVGPYVTRAASVLTIAVVAAVALHVVPDLVRGVVPEEWWVHRDGLGQSLWFAGIFAMGIAFVQPITLCEDTPVGSSERVRQSRCRWPERLRHTLMSATATGGRGVLVLGTLAVGAMAPFSAAYAAVPVAAWYVVGILLAPCLCLAYLGATSFVARRDRRGLVACVVVPLVTGTVVWAATVYDSVLALACLGGIVLVTVVLWHARVLPGFALAGAFLGVVIGVAYEDLAPDGGFKAGATVGALLFYVLACVFLGPGSEPRSATIGHLWRRAQQASNLPVFFIMFLAGRGAEVMLGFAGVVFGIVAFGAAELGGSMARGVSTLGGAALGRVPPRPGAFLAWAYYAGLLRVVGGEYEFRHRELREWLARNPR